MSASLHLGSSSIDNSRKILTALVTGATGALTLSTPGISVTVGGVAAAIGTLSTTGTGASAKIIIPLTLAAAKGSAIVITAATSGIVDGSGNTFVDGTSTVTDTATLNPAQQAIQAAANNFPLVTDLQVGFFGNALSSDGVNYQILDPSGSTTIAYAVLDSAGRLVELRRKTH